MMEASMPRTSGNEPIYETLEPVLDAIASWVKKYRYAAGLRGELARCGPDEVALTARELGLSADELWRIARKGPDAADLLQKMLLALGVNPKTLASQDPMIMRDLQRLCITCAQKKRFRHGLAGGTAGKKFCEFCPNAY